MTMKYTLLLIAILCTTLVNAQTDETANVKAAIDTFFEGFHKGDTTLMKTVMMGKFMTQTAFKNKEGKECIKN